MADSLHLEYCLTHDNFGQLVQCAALEACLGLQLAGLGAEQAVGQRRVDDGGGHRGYARTARQQHRRLTALWHRHRHPANAFGLLRLAQQVGEFAGRVRAVLHQPPTTKESADSEEQELG